MLFRAIVVVGVIAALSPALDPAVTGSPGKVNDLDHVALEGMARGAADAVTRQVAEAVVTQAMKRLTTGERNETGSTARPAIPALDRDSLNRLVTDAITATAPSPDRQAPRQP